MPVYNAGKYLQEAITSVLDQEFKDFEFIIVDDGSTDFSLAIIKSFDDDRIRVHKNHQNKGIVYSRNKGIELSHGKYIGMMDADDVALPDKFKKQIAFLDKNPDFGMIGSWAKLIDEYGLVLKENWKLNAKPDKIPGIMLFMNYFVQSAVVFRKEMLPRYAYKEGYEIVEDYKLWLDILKRGKAWNLPEYLLHYRIHYKSATQSKEATVNQNLTMVYEELFESLDIKASSEEMKMHHEFRTGRNKYDLSEFLSILVWLEKLYIQNKKLKRYPEKYFLSTLFNRILKAFKLTDGNCLKCFTKILSSPITRHYLISRFQ